MSVWRLWGASGQGKSRARRRLRPHRARIGSARPNEGGPVPDVAFTWLGHGSYRMDSPGGKRIYFDPWLENPKCPESEREPERIDVMVLSHGHSDHVGSAVELGRRHSPAVVAIFELANWLEAQGVENATAHGMNKGGTVEVEGIKFHMTHALHSGGLIANGDNIIYLGDAA